MTTEHHIELAAESLANGELVAAAADLRIALKQVEGLILDGRAYAAGVVRGPWSEPAPEPIHHAA